MARASLVVKILVGRGRKVCLCRSIGFCLIRVLLFSGLGGRDAKPCIQRVRFTRCPASVLVCFELGPLGDASGNYFPCVGICECHFSDY